MDASMFDSFESYPRVNYKCNLAETLSIEVSNTSLHTEN